MEVTDTMTLKGLLKGAAKTAVGVFTGGLGGAVGEMALEKLLGKKKGKQATDILAQIQAQMEWERHKKAMEWIEQVMPVYLEFARQGQQLWQQVLPQLQQTTQFWGAVMSGAPILPQSTIQMLYGGTPSMPQLLPPPRYSNYVTRTPRTLIG